MDYYKPPDEEDDDGVEEGADKQYQTWKEYTVFLIDAQPSMFVNADVRLEGFSGTETWFDMALLTVRAQLKNKVISSPNDQAAIVFYGTREALNIEGQVFDNVYLWQRLDQPAAARIRACEEILKDGKFGQEIGSKSGAAADHLRYGLWIASQQLQGTTAHANKTVYIFSNNMDPTGGHKSNAARTATEQARSRVKELQELKVNIELIPTAPAADADKFRTAPFWKEVLDLQVGKVAEASQQAEEGEEAVSIVTVMQGLDDTIRRKTFKKRPLRSIRLTIGPDFYFGVQLFAMLMPAKKSDNIWVRASDHEQLRTETALIDQETGALVSSVQTRKRVFPKPQDPDKPQPSVQTCWPEVHMTTDELAEMKRMVDQGIHLLGFKPLARLKQWHNLRPPTFVYPDEKNQTGSTAAFIALYDAMLEQGVMGIASEVRTAGGPPKLVALVPTPELYGEGDVQIEPPGFMAIQLPWSDDIRAPEAEPFHVDAAEAMIQALSLEPTEDDPGYYSGLLPNPALQRHYQVLESLALDEEPPEAAPDATQPEQWRFDQAADAIKAYKELVYGEGYDADITGKKPKAATKRKAAELGDDAKELLEEIDWAGLKQQNKLDQLKNDRLKVYCKGNGLPVSGTKAILIQRIAAHLDSKSGT